ncbi:MAG: hypothetical protein HYV97_06870 [Bdellovibrio sp.]|nr:hypothetical protein [Bdellovibrio sp.]
MRSNFFLLAFSFFLIGRLWATTEVRGNSLTQPTVYASNNGVSYLTLVAEGPGSGSGETETEPYTAYIPLGSTAAAQEVCTVVSDGTLLPEPPTVTPPSANGFVKISLRLKNDSGVNKTLYAAIKDGSVYEAFTLSTSTTIASSANAVTTFDVIFTLGNFCTNQSSSCSTISTSATNGQREAEFTIYFFLDSTVRAAGDNITTSEEGLFYSLKISDKMPSGSYELVELHKGDERLVAELKDGDLITQMGSNLYRSMVFQYTGAPVDDECPGTAVTAARGTIYSQDTAVLNGLFTIKSLVNETPYTFAFALVNKFQFTTGLNNALTETPQSIEALLRANACFLLTAGFEGNHPVIEYFRKFRDQVLLGEFWGGHLGKLAVVLYYHFGPDLARKIIAVNSQSPVDLKRLIRTTSTWLYDVMRHLWH